MLHFREDTCGYRLSTFVGMTTERTLPFQKRGIWDCLSQHGQLRGEFWSKLLKIAVEVHSDMGF